MTFEIQARDDGPVEVLVYDNIYTSGCDLYGGVCADDIVTALRPYKDRDILVRINSDGGDVKAGLSLYNVLREYNVTTIIDGWAASAASIVALAGKSVQIARNAFIMIHNPSGLVIGEAKDMRQMADELDMARDTLIDIYTRETGNTAAKVGQWMDQEKWFTGEKAFEAGFVDEVIDEPAKAVRVSNASKAFRRIPQAIRNQLLTPNHKPEPMPTDKNIEACGCGGVKLPAAAEKPDPMAALTKERDDLKAQNANLQGQLELLTKNNASALKARAITAVDTAIADKRLDPVLREPMVRAYVENEGETLTKLAELKPPAPEPTGAEPLRIRGDNGSKSLSERIAAELDPKKRQAMRAASWNELIRG